MAIGDARLKALQAQLKNSLSSLNLSDEVLADVGRDLGGVLDLFGGCHEGCKPGCKSGCTDGCQNVSKP